MSKAVFYKWATCMDCRAEDKIFRVRWPDGKEQMRNHLNKEHDYDLTDEDIEALNPEN